MAKSIGAWGIDIGQCALKALHCRLEGDKVVADAFDYVEYPKILSQPEADPDTLVKEALEQFLARNQVALTDRVAISVPGQSGLAKFFKPPPVDMKKIPDIVRYEAKQQIPFPLDEVIWDYQKLAGGQEIDGFAIDAEVGLFAMKREQVRKHLRPFERAEVALDVVQLAPICIYNFVSYDVLTDGPAEDMYDADDPPESIVVLSMGTDATDLVITNGFRVWQRSIPLGGNHFTKQLTKELKLTFAKAEHLKRNARQAEDPKSVFQAMRPIFNDVVTEVQRSIGYFQGIDRKAKIKGVILLGNAVKLPGLQQYVAKNLGYEVFSFDKFNRLEGSSVVNAPAFNDNILAFGVSYGLCLQMLGQSRLKTSLLPREILTQRMIKAKKPWAIASLEALLIACSFNFFFTYRVLSEVTEEREIQGVSWKKAETDVDEVKTLAGRHDTTFADKKKTLGFLEKVGEEVIGAADRRLTWLELLKAIDSTLPWTEGVVPGEYVEFKKLPLDKRKELYIEYVESQYSPNLETWWSEAVQQKYQNLQRELGTDGAAPASPAEGNAPAAAATDAPIPGPTGPGWIVELKGHHYFNSDLATGGAVHLRSTLLKNLDRGSVTLPVDYEGQQLDTFTMKEMGIQFPVLASDGGQPQTRQIRNPDFEPPRGTPQGGEIDPAMLGLSGIPGIPGISGDLSPATHSKPGASATGVNGKGAADDAAAKENAPFFTVKKYEFIVQFCWKEKRLSERLKEREQLRKKQAELEAAKPPSDTPPGETAPSDAQTKPAGETAPSDPQTNPAGETAPSDPQSKPAPTGESAAAETPKTTGGEN